MKEIDVYYEIYKDEEETDVEYPFIAMVTKDYYDKHGGLDASGADEDVQNAMISVTGYCEDTESIFALTMPEADLVAKMRKKGFNLIQMKGLA